METRKCSTAMAQQLWNIFLVSKFYTHYFFFSMSNQNSGWQCKKKSSFACLSSHSMLKADYYATLDFRGCSQTTLTRFWLFWPPTPSVDILHGMNIDKKWTFLYHLPIMSCKRSLWTTSYPRVHHGSNVHVFGQGLKRS